MISKALIVLLASAVVCTAAPKKSAHAPAKKPAAAPAKKTYDDDGDNAASAPAPVGDQATLDASDLAEFSSLSPIAQKFVKAVLHLTKCRLTYRFGSCDPANGGMDCSGTIHFLLRYMGLKEPPRDASSILPLGASLRNSAGSAYRATCPTRASAILRPGDLLFWEGTYDTGRNPPISHTMVYLGRAQSTGAPVMAGASDGRKYRGVKRNGVSVFDFTLPKPGSRAVFVGFARIPGL